MRRNIRNLIIVAVCIVFLGGALLVLKLTGNDKGASSSDSSTASIALVSKKSTDVVSMKVTNKKGSYTLLPVEKNTVGAKSSAPASSSSSDSSSSDSSGSSDVTYTVKELAGCPINTSATSSVVQNGFSLVASKNLGTVSNLDEFGLKNPQATVEVTFKDGSSFNYKVGKVSPTDSSAYYMCGENSSDVYIVSIDEGLLEDAKYFVNKEVLSIKNSQGDNDFEKIRLSGANYPQPVTLSKVDKALKITAPEAYEPDDGNLGSMESALTSLTADSVEALNPDAAALKKYGFDKPAAVAEFTVNKGSYKLIAGAKKGDKYYLMLGGSNIVYTAAVDSVKAWVETGLFGLRSKLILIPMIGDVKSLTVTVGNTVNQLNVTRTKDEKKSTQDKTYYNYKLTGNGGKTLDYEKNYTNFYSSCIGITILAAADKVPSGKPDLTLEYRYYEKSAADIVAFYKTGDRRYTAILNGKPFGIVTQEDITKVTQNIELLESGKAVV